MKNKITNWIIMIAFLVFFLGTIYFVNFKPELSNSLIAFIVYGLTALFFIISIRYGKNNISTQIKQGWSPENRKKTSVFISILFLISIIINYINNYFTKYFSRPISFSINFGICLILFAILFYFFRNKKR
jgi:hypothetical protein